MLAEKTIKICGKDVKMRYCAASETGYEMLSGQSASIFVPEVEYAEDGTMTGFKQQAKTDDYIKLAIASIVAAYERNGEEPPITAKEVMYDADPSEVSDMITSAIELRAQWYNVPKTIPENEFEETDEKPKNAPQPAKRSKRS